MADLTHGSRAERLSHGGYGSDSRSAPLADSAAERNGRGAWTRGRRDWSARRMRPLARRPAAGRRV